MLIFLIVLLFAVIRLVTFPFRIGGRRYNPYGYGYGGCYGYHRRRGPGHLIAILIVLFVLSHVFGHHHHHHWL